MVICFHYNPDSRKKRCPHKTFRQILVYELVLHYLDNKANPELGTSVTRGRLLSISSIPLSGKCFQSSNHPVCKMCVVCAYKKNNAGNYIKNNQTTLKNIMVLSGKTVSSDTIPVDNQRGNRSYNIFAMKVAFSSFYFFFRIFLLKFYLF